MRSWDHKVHTVYTSEVRKRQQKLMQGLCQKDMHSFRLCRKYLQSFKKISLKFYEELCSKKIGLKFYEELCSRGTHCLYIEGEKWLSSQCGKSDKNDLTIISKPHAQPHTKKKTHAKFQNNRYKTVWGVALTRYPLSTYWGWKITKFIMWKKWQKMS